MLCCYTYILCSLPFIYLSQQIHYKISSYTIVSKTRRSGFINTHISNSIQIQLKVLFSININKRQRVWFMELATREADAYYSWQPVRKRNKGRRRLVAYTWSNKEYTTIYNRSNRTKQQILTYKTKHIHTQIHAHTNICTHKHTQTQAHTNTDTQQRTPTIFSVELLNYILYVVGMLVHSKVSLFVVCCQKPLKANFSIIAYITLSNIYNIVNDLQLQHNNAGGRVC